MSLFKNSVGRPSNETLKKRRIVATVLLFTVVLAIGGCVFFTVNHFKTTGTNKNISSGSIHNSISIKNKSGPIYVGTEKTKEGDFKVVGSKNLEISLNDFGKANIVVRTTYDSVKTYAVKDGRKKYYYQVQSFIYDKNNRVIGQTKKVDIKKTTIDQSITIDSNASYIMVQFYSATKSHTLINSIKVPVQARYITNMEKVIPDSNFRECIFNYYKSAFEIKIKSDLTDNDLKRIKGTAKYPIDCSKKNIKDVTGIEKMLNLVAIDLGDNSIKSLDISKNTKLEYLHINNNELTKIDVSKNLKLKELNVNKNKLTSININSNLNLKILDIGINELSDINVKNNKKLEKLKMGLNSLKRIDVTSNTKLIDLDIGYNKITSLDLSKNKNLKVLNAINNGLSTLDLTKNTKLKELTILKGNPISKSNIKVGNNKNIKIS